MNILFKIKIIFLFAIILYGNTSFGRNYLHQTISSSFGMVNINVTENASSLSGVTGSSTTTSSGGAASSSIISIDMIYEFQNYIDKSYFIKATGPIMSSDNSGFFLGAAGMNFYFNSLSSLFSFSDGGTNLIMRPSFRYYIGAAAGVGFLVYTLATAKKSDLIFDIELHGGMNISIGKRWGLRGELAVSRGVGISTSNIGIKAFMGLNYYLETKNFF